MPPSMRSPKRIDDPWMVYNDNDRQLAFLEHDCLSKVPRLVTILLKMPVWYDIIAFLRIISGILSTKLMTVHI